MPEFIKFSSSRTGLFAIVFSIATLFVLPAVAGELKDQDSKKASTPTLPIKFFQKSFSKADGDRCPMYPSCSHYAAGAIKKHGAFKGWVLSFDRLLRCGRDEVRLSPKVRINGKAMVFDPVEANTRWWSKDREMQ